MHCPEHNRKVSFVDRSDSVHLPVHELDSHFPFSIPVAPVEPHLPHLSTRNLFEIVVIVILAFVVVVLPSAGIFVAFKNVVSSSLQSPLPIADCRCVSASVSCLALSNCKTQQLKNDIIKLFTKNFRPRSFFSVSRSPLRMDYSAQFSALTKFHSHPLNQQTTDWIINSEYLTMPKSIFMVCHLYVKCQK